MTIVFLGVYGFIACMIVLAIMVVREKKSITGAALEDTQAPDFLSVIGNYKRDSLAKHPWNMQYEVYKTIATVCSVVFAVLAFITSASLVYALIAAAAGVLVPEIIVHFQASKQRSAFEERYARGLRQMAASLKSGLSIHQSIEEVCKSPFVHDDVRREFQQLDADLKLGIPIKEGFERFADRVDCIDAKDVAIAIGMQASTGGREAQVVEAIAKNISDRLMLRKEVNSMFAGSSGTIFFLDVIPFAIIAFMLMYAKGFMQPYFDYPSLMLLMIALLIFMGIGSIVIHKIVTNMRKEFGLL